MSCLQERLSGEVDLLLCNPPYVSTSDEETRDTDIRAAWAGGADGMLVTAELVDLLVTLLSQSGVAYIVLEKCNKPALVQQHVENLGLKYKTVITRRAGIETLSVIKVTRL